MSSSDRKLLGLAAKAAGYQIEWVRNFGCHYRCEQGASREQWRPLDDDGDALRLAVKLGIETFPDRQVQESQTAFTVGRFGYNTWEEWKDHRGDACSAMRRAIVRAAAQIGASIP